MATKKILSPKNEKALSDLIDQHNANDNATPVEKVTISPNKEMAGKQCTKWKQVYNPDTGDYDLVCVAWA